jgi:protein-disulfide isomerase
MPSGKASKRRRTTPAPPPVRGPGQTRERKASPKILVAAGIVAVGVIVAVVVGFALQNSSSNAFASVPALGSLQGALPGSGDVESLFKGIPQNGTTLGSSHAPVTMTEFIDPQCPYCREFETTVLPSLVKDYVRNGKVRIQMEPWAFIGPDSTRGQAAELAAAQQNRAFNFAELLYFNQGVENTGWLDDAMIASAARSIPGLHTQTLDAARSSSAVKQAQQKVDALALTDKISGTPTLFVGPTGSKGTEVAMSSPTDKAAVVAALTRALNA